MVPAPKRENRRPLVVKFGGSLYDSVPSLIPVLSASPRPLLIVPGGGPFANVVRQAGLDDEMAHWEAIAAMDRYGEYVASFGLPVTEQPVPPETPTVFLPLRCLKERDPLPHSWDVTSDTIAAWIAAELGLDLILLKSVDGIPSGLGVLDQVSAVVETDVVDPLFIPFVIKNKVETFILNGRHPDLLAGFLRGEPVWGTQISTTF